MKVLVSCLVPCVGCGGWEKGRVIPKRCESIRPHSRCAERHIRKGKEMLEIQGCCHFVAQGGRTDGSTLGPVIICEVARTYFPSKLPVMDTPF